MEGVGEDSDGVGEVAAHEFDGHEDERHESDLDQLGGDLIVLLIHRI